MRATFPQLPEALRLIKAWGFQYKLENKYASQNKDELVSFLKSLKEDPNNIIESCVPVEEMKNVF